MNEVISVIVPVYNVEAYVRQCVDSIVSQTYKDLEIILVDDGSTDSSGEICDYYATVDSWVKVIHKKNGGLSEARNVGLQHSTGEYIGFVDSDDYIAPNMYELLHNMCKEYDVKLACCRWCFESEDGNDSFSVPEPTHIKRVVKDDELLMAFLTNRGNIFASISVWDRLYHRSIIQNLTFPRGKCYEDLVYSVKAVINAGECGYVDEAFYHYRIRKDSITQEDFKRSVSVRVYTDEIPLKLEQIEVLRRAGKRKMAILDSIYAYSQFLVYESLAKDNQRKKIANDAHKEIRPKLLNVLGADLSFSQKIAGLLKVLFPKIFVYYYKRKLTKSTV
jgi:glycosyltransferase involved in cell wall biosynthesis